MKLQKTFHPRYHKVFLYLLFSLLFSAVAAFSMVALVFFCLIKGVWDRSLLALLFAPMFAYFGYVFTYSLVHYTCWVKIDGREVVVIHPFLFRRIKIDVTEKFQYGYSHLDTAISRRSRRGLNSTIFLLLQSGKVIEFAIPLQGEYELLQKFIRANGYLQGEVTRKWGWWGRKLVYKGK